MYLWLAEEQTSVEYFDKRANKTYIELLSTLITFWLFPSKFQVCTVGDCDRWGAR
jgi:hypothetical protein